MKGGTTMRKITLCSIVLILVVISGCGGGKGAETAKEKDLTLGVVQKEIHTGMSQADVAEALGSPNIVTKDSNGKETWIYDKIATEATYSGRSGYWTLILFGMSGGSSRTTTTQRTLTVVIKFDKQNQVETLTYHASKF